MRSRAEARDRAEIRNQRLVAEAGIRRAKAEVVRARGELLAVQVACSHPVKRTKRHYDDSTTEFCDDCGWSR